jgi:hypothetical protein
LGANLIVPLLRTEGMRGSKQLTWILGNVVLAGALFGLAACEGRKSVPPATAPATATTKAKAAPTPRPGGGGSIAERLAEEARTRPAGAIRLEDLVAKLEEHGVAIARSRQVLAEVVGARYCALALTQDGLGVVACEYDSPEAAQAGLADSKAKFDKALPGRRLLTNGKTLLTLTAARAALEEESKTVTALFAQLAPRSS